jgi:hypothetical protein
MLGAILNSVGYTDLVVAESAQGAFEALGLENGSDRTGIDLILSRARESKESIRGGGNRLYNQARP